MRRVIQTDRITEEWTMPRVVSEGGAGRLGGSASGWRSLPRAVLAGRIIRIHSARIAACRRVRAHRRAPEPAWPSGRRWPRWGANPLWDRPDWLRLGELHPEVSCRHRTASRRQEIAGHRRARAFIAG
jgi:hypothetical protein